MAMIEVSNLTLERGGRPVLENFNCSIGGGAITALIGRNGIGKSSLLAAIAGERLTTTGKILINGREISNYSLKELASIRAVAQQHHSYWMPYTTREILALGNEGVSSERFSEVVAAINMAGFIDQKVTALSGGQMQRIEIARAFMRDVPIVLLDEPFASQDLASIERLKEFLQKESSGGRTIVMVAHAGVHELEWCSSVINLEAK